MLIYNFIKFTAVTEGTDAQATVSVKIEEKGKTTVGPSS
jgi:2-isopropylmalate synthase